MGKYIKLILSAVLLLASTAANSNAQDKVAPQAAETHVAMTKLFPPVYPPLPKQTGLKGDVEVDVEIKEDGSVSSVTAVSGHPLLQQAALDSARRSQFECRNCGQKAATLRLVYTFQIATTDNCCSDTEADATNNQPGHFPQITESSNHVTVVERQYCTCDPGATVSKVRSPRCLYLWKCAYARSK